MTPGKIFLLLGPSGVGKSTLIKYVLKKYPEISYYPSYTTRLRRPGEIEGQDYFFVSEGYFEKKIKDDFFIEIDKPHNSYYYGIAKEPLFKKLLEGKLFIRDTALNALKELQKTVFKESVISIFLKPEKAEDIKARLLERDAGQDLSRFHALQKELQYEKHCQHTILIKHKNVDFGIAEIVKLLSEYLREIG